jgi:cytoskeletal protein RodZ
VSIGQALAAAREDAGMSVEQVAAATRIRRTLIESIEQDDFAPCGGDFYARGHIRNIAATVGADEGPLLAEFDASRGGDSAPRATEVFESETAARPERRGPNWTAAMAAALVLVVAFGVVQAVTHRSSDKGPDTAGAPVASPSSTGTAEPSSPVSTPPNPSAVAQAPRDRVTVTLRAKGSSWVQATNAGGKELFQGLLQAGQVKTFTDKQRIKLVVGNAGAVVLTVNGTSVGAPGRAGQVARVQFGPQDPAAG